MNHYPSWWDNTITLYNKYVDTETKAVKWYRHVIENCFYKHTLDKITVGNTTIASDVSICRIRINDNFIGKADWNELPEEDKLSRFTLSTGDMIVVGNVNFEIDEYTKDHRSSDLAKKYKEWPGCFTIETVSINIGGGRGNEHYYVKGV